MLVDEIHSKHYLPIKPGTDIALLLAWMNVLVTEELSISSYELVAYAPPTIVGVTSNPLSTVCHATVSPPGA